MTSATDELRRLLDERGVEYESETEEDGWVFVRWHGFDDTGWVVGSDEVSGLLDLRGRYLFTPEQAIAATLGNGTCEMYRVSNTQDVRKCSACGKLTQLDYPLDRDHLNYCPNCGRKVEND